MLEVSGLGVSYGAARAVDGLDIEVGTGECVALLGPNGAGKTTTLRALSGLVRHEGTVRFDGVDLGGRTPPEIARMGLIQVPEGRRLFPTLTVQENLQMGLVAAGDRTGGYTLDDTYDLLPALTPLRRRAGFSLSGGEQQMVALGRALVAAPRMLLLDEPSLGLAPVVAHAIFEALGQIAARTPLLVVEQNTADALRLCSRAYVLVAGGLRFHGSADELADRDSLLASFLGQREARAFTDHE